MSKLSHLKALQALEISIRTGSFTKASDELGITPAALGQRIKSLESYLNTPLLYREKYGVRPTEALQEAIPELQEAFSKLERTYAILQSNSANLIRVSAEPNFVNLWLLPRIEQFNQRYPMLEVIINSQDEHKSSKPDLTIDFAKKSKASKQLFQDYIAPVLPPYGYDEMLALDNTPLLENIPLLHLTQYEQDEEALDWPKWIEQFGYRDSAADRGPRFANSAYGYKAVYSGAGVLLAGLMFLLDDLKTGKLMLPFEPEKGGWTQFCYQLQVSAHAKQSPQIAKFCEWLLQEGSQSEQALQDYLNVKI